MYDQYTQNKNLRFFRLKTKYSTIIVFLSARSAAKSLSVGTVIKILTGDARPRFFESWIL